MDRLGSAVSWSGTDVTLSMFVVSPHAEIPALDQPNLHAPEQVRAYELVDEADMLRGLHVYEYDLVWSDIPPDLHQLVTECLMSALKKEAIVAWFGFEGSFDFEYLLHPDIAGQVYAVAVGEAVRLALEDEYRLSDDWRQLLAQLRDRIVP